MQVRAPAFRIRSSNKVVFAPDEEHLVSLGRDVVLWHVPTRKRLRSNRLLSHPAAAAFAPSARVLAVKNTAGQILTCVTATADPLSHFTPDGPDEGANLLFVAEDTLVDGSWSGEIRLRSTTDLAPRVLHRTGDAMVTRVVNASDANAYAFLVAAKHTHVGFTQGADVVLTTMDLTAARFAPVTRSWQFLRDVAINASGQLLAVRSGTTDPAVEVVDIASGRTLVAALVTQGGTGWALKWAPDDTHVVLVEERGFSFRDASTLHEVAWLPSPYPASIDFAPNRGLIALGDWENGIVARWPGILDTLAPRARSRSVPVRQN